jgi:hypothetical protein
LSNPWHEYFKVTEEKTLEASVHKMLQTQFFPTLGVYRGLAKSFNPSAVAFTRSSTDVVISAGNNAFSALLIPSNGAGGNFLNIGQAAVTGTGISNPFASGSVIVAGPYSASNPGTDWRPISASLQIFPEGTLTVQGGAGVMFYDPNAAVDLVAGGGTGYTRNTIDQLPIMNDWNGLQPIILHWTPSGEETDFVNATPGIYSGIGVYLTGLATGASFRLEYSLVWEYVPNAAFTSLVEKKTATVHPDTAYWTSLVAQTKWSPLMLATVSDYKQELCRLQSLGGVDLIALGNVGMSGLGQNSINLDQTFGENPASYTSLHNDLYDNSYSSRLYNQSLTGLRYAGALASQALPYYLNRAVNRQPGGGPAVVMQPDYGG